MSVRPSTPVPPSSSASSPSPALPAPASPGPPTLPLPLPLPLGTDAPATCEVPQFAPLLVRGGRYGLGRLARRRGQVLAAGLAVTAAALVAAGPGAEAGPHRAERPRGRPAADPAPGAPGSPGRRAGPAGTMRAPVRIADAASVRLLRPGDRVDVIAAEDPSAGGGTRVLAHGARVAALPEALSGTGRPGGGSGEQADGSAGDTSVSGALVVLSVPPATAARLVGASATARLAVTLW
ncbi:RcpC/CpaB family pilus assembly protein [Streptomyces sp. NPDC090108]|uniref:RcpC/CpaB family pilus assembly protein n=1 Tax=Streptomyces sp. NPDC090108 TaxID=3365947 RepID=UPI0037FA7BDA